MAYKILLFFYLMKRDECMKEIGEKLKEARENIGITIEEAAEDLKLEPIQIEQIESGDMDSFQDIFYLKYFIRDYSKYLGLNKEDMVDEFNEYLFDYTSKISLEDIKNARKKVEKKDDSKTIHSPYTMEYKKNTNVLLYVGIVFVLVIVFVVGYFLLKGYFHQEENRNEQGIAFIDRGVENEFTK